MRVDPRVLRSFPLFLLVVGAVALGLVFGARAWDEIASRPSFVSLGLVSRAGEGFVADGAPLRLIGVNLYNAAADPAIFQCEIQLVDADIEVESWFRRVRQETGANVIRFWAFQSYTQGGTNWQALDRVVSLAKQNGLRLIPVLENEWPDCTEGGYKDAGWYAGGYLNAYGAYPLSYREYVTRVVERYRDEPAIAAWSLMNEAESKTSAGTPDAESLYAFTRDMSEYVKSLDPSHLVTLGVMGGAQPGLDGDNYERIHALPGIDFAEYHDAEADDKPLVGAPLSLDVPLNSAIFDIDAAYQWRTADYQRNAARTWQTLTQTIPDDAAQPTGRVGVNFYGTFTGDVYVDDISIGGRVFDFEDGTTQGWSATGPIAFSNAADPTAPGNRVLKLTFSQPTRGAQLFLAEGADAPPGTPISVQVYADSVGTPQPDNTLAADLYRMRRVGKPLVVDQASMTTCSGGLGQQVETPESRAEKFDAKIGAFLAQNGAGYLVWTWDPRDDCGSNFTSGDPLNDVLARYAR
jgi:hypothetical protein